MNDKKAKVEKKIVATAEIYDILRRPVISEKAAKLAETNGVVFEVASKATKADVIRAMQVIYSIKPTKVNILITKGKVKTFRNKSTGTQRSIKKAYITLPKDAKLDLTMETK